MTSQIIPDHTNKLKFPGSLSMGPCLPIPLRGIGKHYKCRIGYILDTVLAKANNTQWKLITKTLSQSFLKSNAPISLEFSHTDLLFSNIS